ncbi:hypothetical protein CLV46_1394 [Diaminobutyricimonas aerilata]|uniref:Phosphoesterase n=1 Tax=Diaminobutyricimonas aerilata TaxID=1162967 RepID=A0A2M9CIU0_9MICO|nr:metallophosphoesterase [Diaminobutyricimonas aerilata]PJJ71841.1 hypothetical protein CLV46_1394 [Diaminobutyricimonas aerilata]
MAARIVVVADTHVPARAKRLPDAVWHDIEAADLVVHAGDWVVPELLDEFERRSRRFVGVWGNNDGEALRSRLPEVAHVELEGLRMGVVHITGDAKGREQRCDRDHPGLDVLFFGHSHIPWDTVTPAGMRLLNPGSPTDRRRQPFCSYLVVDAHDGELTEVRLVRLPRS